ncbi:phosphatase PAP2 family protein [Corynebacterium sp. MSK122]|uniref:phosphatase PAP2 family protein n=1 Tax=Corynebacterium sp. MSK122 TaxID=3050206 RepID=UPI003AF0AB89
MPNKLSVAESRVLELIQGAAFHVPGVLSTARGLSHWGEHALGWMGSAAVGAGIDKRRREGWVRVGAAAFLAHAASVVLKRIVRRKRPDYPYVRVGVKTPSKLSFPSSHATSTTAFLVAVSRLTGRKAPLLGVPVMMASRMVLGVHYPTDTAVGAAIGAATAEVVMKGMKHER